jgi:hypothetical protein
MTDLRLSRCVAIGVTAMSLLAALPAAANAKDYCVFPNVGCGGTNVETFQKALDLADDDTDADRILLGAWSYLAPSTSGFDYSRSDAPVEIIGKGAGQTVLTAPPDASNVLRLFGGGGSSLRDVRIRIPDNFAYQRAGLSTDGVARRIDVVDGDQQQYERRGVYLEHGGTLEDASVMLGMLHTTAVWIDAGGGTVRGLTTGAYIGVVSAAGSAIERSRFSVGGVAVVGGAGVTTVDDSVLYVSGQPGVGLLVSPLPGADATIDADGLTIVGPGHPDTQAARVNTLFAPDQNGDINLTNSIIRGPNLQVAAPGPGHAKIAVSYSDLMPGGDEIQGVGTIERSNTTNVGDALFADPMLGDYHLLPGSALIDAGDPAASQGSDMDGKSRVADGNGDGIARRDMGAFEVQSEAGAPPPAGGPGGGPAGEPGGSTPVDTLAPLIGGFRARALAHSTRFRYTLSEPARVTLEIQRALPGRRSGARCVAPSPRLRHAGPCIRYVKRGTLRRSGAEGANRIRLNGRLRGRPLRPGRYRAVISALDAPGNRSTPRSARFRIAAG